MTSSDLQKLTYMIFQEGWEVCSVHVEVKSSGQMTASVVLQKDTAETTLESAEGDFTFYVLNFQNVVDTKGNGRLVRLKQSERYQAELMDLIDEDHSKIRKAINEITSGKYRINYSITKLILELLSDENLKDYKKYLPLKTDYHRNLAYMLILSQELNKLMNEYRVKLPGAEKLIKPLDTILMPFRIRENPLKDYIFYRSYLSLDISAWSTSLSNQLNVREDTLQELINRGSTPIDKAIPKIISIYHNCLNILEPYINLLRVGLELENGITAPGKKLPLANNIDILKSNQKYGHLFACLDEQIRHSHAHSSYEIDLKSHILRLMDFRSCPAKVTREYKFEDFVIIVQTMNYDFFPALVYVFYIHDMAMIDLILVSSEFKKLLATIGN